jgi:hypothetical protein
LSLNKAPRSHPEATLRLPLGYPEATLRLPRGYPQATIRGMKKEECRMKKANELAGGACRGMEMS